MSVVWIAFMVFLVWFEGASRPMFYVLVPALVALSYLGFKWQNQTWPSYEIILGRDSITRRQKGLPDLTIGRDAVRFIQEKQGEGIKVFGRGMHTAILVPEELEGFEELRFELRTWEGPPSTAVLLKHYVLVVGATIAFAAAHLARPYVHDPRLLVLIHVVIVVGFLWFFFETRRNTADEKAKQRSWLFLFAVWPSVMEIIRHLDAFGR